MSQLLRYHRCKADICRDHGNLIDEAGEVPEVVAEANANSDQMDTEDSVQEAEDIKQVGPTESQPRVRHSARHTTLEIHD